MATVMLTSQRDGGRGIIEELASKGYRFTDTPSETALGPVSWSFSSDTGAWALTFDGGDQWQ